VRKRLGVQLVLAVALPGILILGAMIALVLRAHREALIGQMHRAADQLGETIRTATREDMLENRRDRLRRQIEALGRQPGIQAVRVYNKEGTIVFASDPVEVGRAVDKAAGACFACHAEQRPLERPPTSARVRIFSAPGGGRLLGIIHPIHNEPDCWTAACHAHGRSDKVLGVLDVTVSLAQVDRDLSRTERRMAGFALAAIAAGALILGAFIRRLVLVPVETLAAATRRVAEGDLTATVPVRSGNELGDLARAFNEMTVRLAEAQRQLAQSDKLASVGRLAAGVAHEINNPLTGVLTYASFLLSRAGPEQKEDLEVIVRETKRCREIVRGLLDFARPAPPRRGPTDVNEVARRAARILMNQLALNRVGFVLDLAEGLPELLADANQLQQVVVNLLVNAADAVGEEGGTIRLATRLARLPAWGHRPIRSARCPKGCDLLDPLVRIGGLPSLRVLRRCQGRESAFHLDPTYGRFVHRAEIACEEGVVADFSCPRCRTSLARSGVSCGRCGAPVFALETEGEGSILWCRRNGCHWSRWDAAESRGEEPVIEIAVEDTGRGISSSDLPHVFEPFFTTKGPRGTGLGLSISWGIVQAHGGTIEVASEEGKGSRFTVRLPVADAPMAVPAEMARTSRGG
jgi:two-component system NtrC family sensor kinase